MATGTVIRRVWTSRGPTGRKVRHVRHGYTVRINGRRERKVSAEWRYGRSCAQLEGDSNLIEL